MTRTDISGIPGAEGFAIAFIVAVISIGCTVGASAWQARFQFPVSYARAEPVPDKPADRVETSLSVHRVPTTSYRLDPPAKKVVLSQPVRSPWPCTLMRLAVEKFGRDAVRQALKNSRHSKSEIDEALACVQEKRT